MRPWRERLREAGLHALSEEATARLDRSDKAMFAAIDVFGNEADAAKWIYRNTTEFGGWSAPEAVALESEEGLQRVLAQLELMRPGITPRPDPTPPRGSGRHRVFRARRSSI